MTKVKTIGKMKLILSIVALAVLAMAATELTPGIPSPFSAKDTPFQAQTHFLVFTGSGTPGENAQTATAYYNAVDPYHQKQTFPQWLVNAGFISDVSQWHPTGPQIIACDLGPTNGCDAPAHNPDGSLYYGDNVINTDSHAIVLNAADLGFVRNQFIRCIPSCSASNPTIFTYLENYPVNPFAASGNGGSGFPFKTGYPSTSEAAAAIASALNRPVGTLSGCDPAKTDTPFGCKISRIADVAFEWSAPPTNPTSSSRYGKLYAYIFQDGASPTETIAFPDPTGGVSPNVSTKTLQSFKGGLTVDPNPANNNAYTGVVGDPFAPNLDFIGFKQHPGVCFICHGGKPVTLTSTGAYPNQGNVSGFRMLPLDERNLLFSSDSGGEQPALNAPGLPTGYSLAYTDRLHQEFQIKQYNLAVLKTVPTSQEGDGTGARRVAHLREVIVGWYSTGGNYSNDTSMASNVQNTDWIPKGWRDVTHGGTAPVGAEQEYINVFSPACRSCHFNREISLDFGTYANFHQGSDLTQFALLPGCSVTRPKIYSPKAGAKYMPLAHLTYQRYWQANPSTGGSPQTLPYPFPSLTITNAADTIAADFGFGTVSGYCATNP